MMKYRTLGRSGIQVSPLGLGTARMAGLGWHDDLAPQDPTQTKQDDLEKRVRKLEQAVKSKPQPVAVSKKPNGQKKNQVR